MKISYNWLRDYVDVSSARDAADLLNSLGMEVEGLESVGDGFSGVIIGEVRSVLPVAGSDHLTQCVVFDGREERTVLCGAPNAAPGRYPYAPPGSRVAGMDINARKMRGIVSEGMLLSKRELGLSEDHGGIWPLPADAPVGEDFKRAYPITDWVIEADVTANRPDLLSIIGVAREIAAATGQALHVPDIAFEPVGGAVDARMSVSIDCPDLCPRYTGIVVEGLTIASSPVWMQRRLEAVGLRPINNLVDITNYVLFECGQPLHAFDEHFLAGRQVRVRQARAGEVVRTLDDTDRTMTGDEVLICDAEKPVAIGGVMGGANSLVADTTRDVFIESAYFAPTSIRRTSLRLGLSTDSSYRFERGIDIEGVPWGLHRAARLMAELGAGRVVGGHIDQYPAPIARKSVAVRPARVNWVLGTNLDSARVQALLTGLGLKLSHSTDDALTLEIPGFRVDLEREIDLIEEVARTHGFRNIDATLPATSTSSAPLSAVQQVQRVARDLMVGAGLSETISLSMTSPESLDAFRAAPGDYVRILNPLSNEMSALRDTLLPALCRCVAFNAARRCPDVAMFETRRVFRKRGEGELPDEPLHLASVITGRAEPLGWLGGERLVDFYDAKGVLELLLDGLRVSDGVWFWGVDNDPVMLPGASARITWNQQEVGRLGQIRPQILESLGIEAPVFGFEINLTTLADAALGKVAYRPWSRFPGTTRDLAVLVDRKIPVGPMISAIQACEPDLIQAVRIFDIYQGQGVEERKKSVAFSIEIQSASETLTTDRIETVVKDALKTLEALFSAKLR